MFLVRFSIEAGLFGPAARCATAALFGLLLIGAAEFGHRIPRLGRIFTDDLRIGHSVAARGSPCFTQHCTWPANFMACSA
ncbi:DUF2339 domain-containing protein [Sphingopyxis sp. BSNA05]|uniref:DUF2339 domain-containing protein n=1 Tax=Sphingopyxis sp. BSNA05 TaxID=1236614 RepID=UPI00349F81DB